MTNQNHNRMDGLVNLGDLDTLLSKIELIISCLSQDGFDIEEIREYINHKVKCVCIVHDSIS